MTEIPATLTFAEAARIVLGPVKDQSYRATPVGVMVGRYMRWLRNEWGATPSTVRGEGDKA